MLLTLHAASFTIKTGIGVSPANSMQSIRIALAVFLLAGLAVAQDKDSVLKPPKGADVAIVIFEDLECPDCARAAPLQHTAISRVNW